MKNIHLLPTDKPSRLCNVLCTEKSTLTLFEDEMGKGKRFFPENIYITSDGEIKNGDWILFLINGEIEIVKVTTIRNNAFETKEGFGYGLKRCKKIILTTDRDLINDGVQSVDDEFLEWFVKNPSYEWIEVQELYFHGSGYYKASELSEDEREKYKFMREYKIIIPKEEPKQETLEDAMRQNGYHDKVSDDLWREGVEFGTKWQEERMYSEEEVWNLVRDLVENSDFIDFNKEYGVSGWNELPKWFEQFKKK